MADYIERLSRELTAKGRLIEAGFVSFVGQCFTDISLTDISPDAPVIPLSEMRNAFFAGARHLFSILDPGAELLTDQIYEELRDFSNTTERRK